MLTASCLSTRFPDLPSTITTFLDRLDSRENGKSLPVFSLFCSGAFPVDISISSKIILCALCCRFVDSKVESQRKEKDRKG